MRNPAFSGVLKQRGMTSKVAASALPSRGPKRGCNCYITPTFSGVPNKVDKIRSGYLTLAFSVAHKRVEVLRNPCILGGTQTKGTKSKVAAAPLHSRGPKREQNCYVTPAFARVSKKGFKKRPHRASGKSPLGEGGP